MSEQKTAVADPVTGLFCEDGMKPGRIVVPVPDNPDPRRHRYSGDPEDPIRDATPSEIAYADAATATVREQAAFDEFRILKALALVVADLTGKTPAQMAALVKARYRALG